MTEKIKTLKIIHFAMCLGLMAACYFIGNITADSLKIPEIDASSIPFLCIPIAAYFLGNFLFRTQLKQIGPNTQPEDKYSIYQTACVIRWAVWEGATFLIVILKPDFMLLVLLMILYFILLRPTEERIRTERA